MGWISRSLRVVEIFFTLALITFAGIIREIKKYRRKERAILRGLIGAME